jgi:Restriction endonuclease
MDNQDDLALPALGRVLGLADLTPDEFEDLVVRSIAAGLPDGSVDQFDIRKQVPGIDGSYELDGHIVMTLAGLTLRLVVEAKHHRSPIKRELVHTLWVKVQSTGAHKGVLVSTASFQSGAITFAKVHGIALIQVTPTGPIIAVRGSRSRLDAAAQTLESGVGTLAWSVNKRGRPEAVLMTESSRWQVALDLATPSPQTTPSEDGVEE